MRFITRATTLLAVVMATMLSPVRAAASDLVVSAASSLTNAFQQVAKAYEAKHPGTHVLLNFASSDTLLRQISNGAPADVYASADQVAMDKAEQQGLLARGSRTDFAANQLVLIVPAGSPQRVAALNELTADTFKRIAWGNPASVPVGRYTRKVLTEAGLYRQLSGKAVLAQNVRQCLDYVARDEVDAGFVYATDAAIAGSKVRVALPLPSPTPITYPLALIAGAAHPHEAASFRAFVLSPPGQAILAGYGFLKP